MEELVSERITLRGHDEVQETFLSRGWSDGLPVIPPTEEKVRAMIAASGRGAADVLGTIPPRFAEASVENVAVNAVMAGCLPEHMPVLVAALEAACDPAFSLYSIQATTHPCAVLMVITGPVVEALGLNAGYGAFAPGNRANATLGRAMRLVQMNVGGALPGKGDQSTQGSPAKYSYCMAENEGATPWEPLRISLGFGAGESTVTVVSGEGPHNINDHVCSSGENILLTVADTMSTIGHNNSGAIGAGDVWVVLGPEHARHIADDGMGREDIQRFLFEHARNKVGRLRHKAMWNMNAWPEWINADDDEDRVPIVEKPADIGVLVAGGAGKHSCFIPTFGLNKSVTRAIALP
jgi:hypothetical protein